MSLVEIRKTFSFEAAHKLPNVPKGHKCGGVHGHSYKITLIARGPCDEKLGWVMDYADMKEAISPLIHQFDHAYLNDIKGLENPTSEIIAQFSYAQLKPKIPTLYQVIISETDSTEARFPIY